MPVPAADILQRFLNKEEKALEEVYTLYYGRLCYFGEKLVINRQAAEEIVVDVFIKTFQANVTLASMEHLEGYLYEAVKNHSLNFLQSQKRYKKHLDQYSETIQANIDNFNNEIIEVTALELIFQAAEGLPTECRRIFEMLYKQQMPYDAVATRLQLKVQTVRNQNARAIAYIRKRLQSPPG